MPSSLKSSPDQIKATQTSFPNVCHFPNTMAGVKRAGEQIEYPAKRGRKPGSQCSVCSQRVSYVAKIGNTKYCAECFPLKEQVSTTCSVCLSHPKQVSVTPCGHIFCTPCLREVAQSSLRTSRGITHCPMCRADVGDYEGKDLTQAIRSCEALTALYQLSMVACIYCKETMSIYDVLPHLHECSKLPCPAKAK